MHTEDEAKKLWCPMAIGGGTNDGRVCTCIASGCAMWRWGEPLKVSTKAEVPRGFCGLSGRPE